MDTLDFKYKGWNLRVVVERVIMEDEGGGNYTFSTSHFYDLDKPYTKKVKRFWLFGEVTEKTQYELLFTSPIDFLSPDRTKLNNRSTLDLNLSGVRRKKEIERGEVV